MAATGRDCRPAAAGRAPLAARHTQEHPPQTALDPGLDPGAEVEQVLNALCQGLSGALLWLKPDLSLRWHSTLLADFFPGLELEAGSDVRVVGKALGDPTLARDAQQAVSESRVVAGELAASEINCTRRILPCGGAKDGVLVLYELPSADHARRDALFQGQAAVLELTAERTPYPEVLDYLLCFIEAQQGGRLKGAICVFDQEGRRLRHVAAPSLPEQCREALINLKLGPEFNVYGEGHSQIAVVSHIGKAPGWEGFRESATHHHLRACWTAPILATAGGVLGLLAVFIDRARKPDRWDRTLIDMVARTAAIAIQYTHQEERARARLRQQEAVARLGRYALEGHDLDAVLERAVNETANTLEVPFCGMQELQPDQRTLLLRVGCGWPAGLMGSAVTVNQSQAGYALLTKAPVIATDLRSETRFQASPMLLEIGVVSGACALILGDHGHNYGVLGAHSRERRDFSDQDIHFIQAVANIIAAALSRHRNEQELLASREDFQRQFAQLTAIYDTAPVGLALFDTELRLQNLNGRLAELVGTPLEAAIGRRLDQLMPPVAAALEEACRRVIGTALPLPDQEIRWRPAGGRELHERVWLCSYYPIISSSGTVLAVNTVIQDITERNLAHEERERLANLVACSRDAIIGKTLEGVITSWNQGAERLYGYSAAEAVGQPIDLIIPLDRRHEFARIREAWRMGEHINLHETERLHKDGRRLHVSLTISPIRDLSGRIIAASTIERDVTDRKEADLALRMSEAALRRQAEELAAADRQKDDFIAMLGHELRNPLAPIANAAQLLQMENTRLDSSLLADSVRIIERQVRQMTRLVDDLLDVARITRGRIELKRAPMEVREAISQAVETLQPALSAKGQRLVVTVGDEALPISADAVRLTQVICNVLSNASKYSEREAQIELSAERCGARARIRVRDHGEGIPAQILPRIFDLFTQADRSLNRPRGGLGLGLTLVKRLVEMHDGTVTVKSDGPGKGAEAVIELPLLVSQEQASGTTVTRWPAPAAESDSRRVLIVDDNTDSAEALGTLLTLRGYAVAIAHDGGSALNAARQQSPHVVFLDIGLPDMSGYEVAADLRRLDGRSGGMRLVALTGYGLGQRGGQDPSIFDQYLLKPIAMEKLQSVLDER